MAATSVAELGRTNVADPVKAVGPVAAFKNFLTKNKEALSLALPSHMKVEPVISAAVSEFAQNEKLQKCTPESIIKSLSSACRLGLTPGANGAGFLVPYGQTCTFVPGWRGLVDLVSRSGNGTVYTGVIFSDQEYTFTDGARRDLIIHNETDMEAATDITHAYAIGWVKGAAMPIIELWRVSKITKHRDKYNKVKGAHYSFRDWEMYARKVPLLQVLKYMPCSVEVQRAIEVANYAETGRNAVYDGEFVTSSDFDMGDTAPAGNNTPSPDQPSEKAPADKQEKAKPEEVAVEQKKPDLPDDGPTVEDALANVVRGDFDMARDIANSLGADAVAAVEEAIKLRSKPAPTRSGGSFRNVE